jgi:uncharacterized protein YndB with AHSA1/START domain
MRIEEHVEIGRSAAEVWDFVADPLNDPLWCSKVKAVEASGTNRWAVWHKPVPFRPRVSLTVEHLVVEPPRRLTMREEDEAGVYSVEYRLDATESGTRLTQVSECAWKRLPRVLRPIYDLGTRRDVRAQLRSLKTVLERA